MEVIFQQWAISKVVRHKAKINPKPQYQRTPVWNQSKKQLLMDTVLRGYDIPKLYLRKISNEQFDWEIADGQQRMRAIWSYVDNQFPLGEVSADLPQGDYKGKYYRDLPTGMQDVIHEFNLHISELRSTTEEQVRDLFLRLQEGDSLNPAEKRNALLGGLRDFVSDLAAEPHKCLPLTRIKNERFAWDNLIAHVVALDLASGPADIKAPELRQAYLDNQQFDPEGPVAKRVKKRLNYLAEVLKNEPPEANIKWGFVDLYQALMILDGEYVMRGRAGDLESFYIAFEQERRAVDDPADLISGTHDEWDRDLYNYLEAFRTQGGTRSKLEIRREVYLRRILRDVPDLHPKDPVRAFTRDQRLVIWRRDGGTCQSCGALVSFDSMQADHLVPHSQGGATTVDNGQTLCAPCNAKKGGL